MPAPTFPASRGPGRRTAAPGSEFTRTREGCGAAGRGRSGAPRVEGSDRGAAPGAPLSSGPGRGPAAARRALSFPAPPNRVRVRAKYRGNTATRPKTVKNLKNQAAPKRHFHPISLRFSET